jgi:hypothetical protein
MGTMNKGDVFIVTNTDISNKHWEGWDDMAGTEGHKVTVLRNFDTRGESGIYMDNGYYYDISQLTPYIKVPTPKLNEVKIFNGTITNGDVSI